MNFSTSGSSSKLKNCLDQSLKQMGYDPDYAHDFTILSTGDNINRKRIIISIEPRSHPNTLANGDLLG